MTSKSLTALAERVERASGPDRELDVAIAYASGLIRDQMGETYFIGAGNNGDYVLESGYYDHQGNAPELPHFSSSLDAAMSLLPTGDGICLNIAQGPWVGHLARVWEVSAELAVDGRDACAWEVACNGQTLPLALTAAALRSRAMMMGE